MVRFPLEFAAGVRLPPPRLRSEEEEVTREARKPLGPSGRENRQGAIVIVAVIPLCSGRVPHALFVQA